MVIHPTVEATSSSATDLKVRAKLAGIAGNGIATTETGANIAWGGATLSGGGVAGLTQVLTPDDVGVISVGYIASFIIVVVAQGFGFNGRFYWIEPFETTIDSLNFATAESSPDPLWSVNVVSDRFALPGSNSTEFWYPTGDEVIPFLRQQGAVFDHGTWEGTALRVQDTFLVVDRDAQVYAIGGSPVVISNPAISERIRQAMNAQIAI